MTVNEVTERVDNASRKVAPTVLRYVAALLWLANVNWKVPPDFGRSPDKCVALCRYVQAGIDHPVVPGGPWFYDNIVSPNLTAFGWLTLFIEGTLIVLLVSGRHIRIAAVLGFVQSFAIGSAVANLSGEWYWSYILMMALHVAILATTQFERPQSAKTMGWVAAGYGAVVGIAHVGAGLSGTGSWNLFSQDNGFPGQWGRASFPGSIALGLLTIALGVITWWVAGNVEVAQRRIVGWVMVVAAVALLLTYGNDGLAIGLGSRPGNLAILAALGLSLAVAAPARDGSSPREVSTSSAE